MNVMQKMKSRKATGSLKVSVEIKITRVKNGVKVMMDMCQHMQDGRELPDQWKNSVIVPIFTEKGDDL